jgi:mannose-6-phosphate isomerase
MPDYPLKFIPILKKKIWGGNKLKEILHKNGEGGNIGESWEISAVGEDISIVTNGIHKGKDISELIQKFGEKLIGRKVLGKFGNNFPLLIKFIDAKTELSVQLHPNDKLARERHNSFGKTEMWYILQADENARINIGFKESIDKATYLKHLQNGTIVDLLNFEKVQEGDAFLINTGKVHAICGGVLLAEIQQTSDITYRIYDWDRNDDQGIPRELHTDLALDAIDFEVRDDFKLTYENRANTISNITNNPYFITNFLSVKEKLIRNHRDLDSFVIYMCMKGKALISVNNHSEEIEKGETLLIPASSKEVEILTENSEFLEIYIE